jgi:hypothetical protein
MRKRIVGLVLVTVVLAALASRSSAGPEKIVFPAKHNEGGR